VFNPAPRPIPGQLHEDQFALGQCPQALVVLVIAIDHRRAGPAHDPAAHHAVHDRRRQRAYGRGTVGVDPLHHMHMRAAALPARMVSAQVQIAEPEARGGRDVIDAEALSLLP
jgi:hypothetical protein